MLLKKYIDISYAIDERTITPPAYWHPTVRVTQLGRHCLEGCESYKVSVGTHTGTHIDTPAHMISTSDLRIDKIPLETTNGKCKMLRIPKDEDGEISVNDLESCNIEINRGDRVVINTGWYKTWNTQKFFCRHPYITKEAAYWLVDKGVIFVLIDMPSPDNPQERTVLEQLNPVHLIFLSKGVIISECITNLDLIKCNEFELIALPLKMKGLDGAPTRIVAVVEE